MVSHHRTEMTRGSGGNACGRVSTYDGGQGRSASSSLSDLAAPDDQHVRRRPPECGRERAIEKTPAAGPSGLRLGSGIGRSGLLLVATLCLIKPWGASAAGEDIGADPTRIGLSADATEAVSAVAASPTLVTLAVAPDGPGLAATLQEAEEILEWLKREINEVWERRGEIQPSFACAPEPRVLEILKLLPKTNCRQCGEPTCMVFAVKVGQEVIPEVMIRNEAPLPPGVLIGAVVTGAGKIDPIGMAELVPHEVQISRTRCGNRYQPDHFM